MASAGRTLGRQYNRNVGRDGFRFLGRTRTATKSLKGRLAVAQPPGATMAVTGKQVNTRHARSKRSNERKANYEQEDREFPSTALRTSESLGASHLTSPVLSCGSCHVPP